MMHAEEPIVTPPVFELFWEEYRQTVLVTAGAVVALLIAVGGILLWQHSRSLAADALFFSATDKSGWEDVVARYPRSGAAANALLLIAAAQRAEKNVVASDTTYTQFVEKFPKNSLAITALLGKAMNADLAGNPQGAIDTFQQAASAYPESYGAPFALMMEARILIRLGKKEEAKRVLQMLSNQFPDSLVNTVLLHQGAGTVK